MPIPRNKIPILDPHARECLQRVVSSGRSPVALHRRAHAILLLAEGHRPSETARRVGLHRVNIFRWMRRFCAGGVDVLFDSPRQRKCATPVVAVPIHEPPQPVIESRLAASLRELAARNAEWPEG